MENQSGEALQKGLSAGIGIALIMVVLPWVITSQLPSEYKSFFIPILFRYINPLFLLFTGLHIGDVFKKLWFMPIVSDVVFLLTAVLLFSPWKTVNFLYAVGYIAIGYATMLVGWGLSLLRNEKNRKKTKISA